MPSDEGFYFNTRVLVFDSWCIYFRIKCLGLRSWIKVKRSPTGEVFFHSSCGRRNRQKVCIKIKLTCYDCIKCVTATQGHRVVIILRLQLN